MKEPRNWKAIIGLAILLALVLGLGARDVYLRKARENEQRARELRSRESLGKLLRPEPETPSSRAYYSTTPIDTAPAPKPYDPSAPPAKMGVNEYIRFWGHAALDADRIVVEGEYVTAFEYTRAELRQIMFERWRRFHGNWDSGFNYPIHYEAAFKSWCQWTATPKGTLCHAPQTPAQKMVLANQSMALESATNAAEAGGVYGGANKAGVGLF